MRLKTRPDDLLDAFLRSDAFNWEENSAPRQGLKKLFTNELNMQLEPGIIPAVGQGRGKLGEPIDQL